MSVNIMALFVTVPVVCLTASFVYVFRMTTEPEPEPTSPAPARTAFEKSRRYGYWASAISLAVVYVATGIPKVSGLDQIIHRFEAWGYSDEFMLFVGVTEFLAGIFLLVPRAAKYAAGYLIVIMAGAVYTHVAYDTFALALLPLGCLAFLVFVAYEDWLGEVHEEKPFGDEEPSNPSPATG